jgi:hypothetical protein
VARSRLNDLLGHNNNLGKGESNAEINKKFGIWRAVRGWFYIHGMG